MTRMMPEAKSQARAGWGLAAHALEQAMDPAGAVASLPDAALVARFEATGDEAAFAALVDRHGPMVLAAARAVVRSAADAEDVFQATWLVLARRAGAIRSGTSVGGWLYRIARRTATRAVRVRAARSRREQPGGSAWVVDPVAAPDGLERAEVARLVHEELARLPDPLRAAVLACDLEGLTRDEAAARLGWPAGTVASRVGRGRNLLRARLHRRGIGADAALAVLARRLDPVPPPWITAAARAGSATHAPALANAVVRGLARATLGRWAGGLSLLGALVLGPGLISQTPRPTAPPAPMVTRGGPIAPLAAATTAADSTEPFLFRGQVVDPDGAPVAGAKVFLVDQGRHPAVAPTPSARADERGRFQFRTAVPRPQRGPNGAPPTAHDERVRLLATAPGFGVGFVRPPWAGPIEVSLTRDAGPVTIRVVDAHQRPVAGARVVGLSLLVPPLAAGGNGGLLGWIRQAEMAKDRPTAQTLLAKGLDHALDGPDLAVALQFPPTTDADGRITINGLGQDRALSALVAGSGIATQAIVVTAEPASTPPLTVNGTYGRREPGRRGFEATVAILGNHATLVGKPGVAVAGTVRNADSGAPLPGVVVRLDDAISPLSDEPLMQATTDEAGRYRLDGVRSNSRAQFSTESPDGSAQLDLTRLLDIEAGPDEGPVPFDLPLPPTVAVVGRVEAPPGGPLAGITVQAHLDPANGVVQRLGSGAILPDLAAKTDAEGQFRLRTLRGPGFLTATRSVQDDAYGIGAELLVGLPLQRQPRPSYSTVPEPIRLDEVNTIVRIDPPAGTPEVAAAIALRRPIDRAGTVVDPTGQPVRSGVFAYGLEGLVSGSAAQAELTDEQFTVRRLVEGRLRRVLLVRRSAQQVGLLTTRDTDGPPLVAQLQPWGAVRVRVDAPEDEQGRGFVYVRPVRDENESLFPDSQFPFDFNNQSRTNNRPQFEVSALVPDYPYDLVWGGGAVHPVLARNVRVGSGQTLDLGTIRVERPQ